MDWKKKAEPAAICVSVILYIAAVICLFWFQPFVACAAETDSGTAKESVPGGKGNTVHVYVKSTNKIYGSSTVTDRTLKAKDDAEIVGFLTDYINDDGVVFRQLLDIVCICNGEESVSSKFLSDFVGVTMAYDRNGELVESRIMDIDDVFSKPTYYEFADSSWAVKCTVSGMKIFRDRESYFAYRDNGSLDGLVNIDVDSGDFDKDIGYLHDLKHHGLMYGEKDENGLYSSYDDRFSWSDYYPEYDDSYLVEVRASCEVEVKKWFGIGKSTIYNSDIRELSKDVPYKNLEYIISLSDEKAVFSDFLNEYMPGNNSVSDVISAATFQFDAYYFRIYRWDEESKIYKYGLWVRLTKDGSALTGSLDETVDAGDFDDEGNWKPDPDSDYGDGESGSLIPGEGGSQDDAKDDADKNQEDKDNGDKNIDLSNTNFKELWEWFTGCLVSFWNGLGVIPDFFGRLFSFLPSPIIGFLGLAIIAAIILRVVGR